MIASSCCNLLAHSCGLRLGRRPLLQHPVGASSGVGRDRGQPESVRTHSHSAAPAGDEADGPDPVLASTLLGAKKGRNPHEAPSEQRVDSVEAACPLARIRWLEGRQGRQTQRRQAQQVVTRSGEDSSGGAQHPEIGKPRRSRSRPHGPPSNTPLPPILNPIVYPNIGFTIPRYWDPLYCSIRYCTLYHDQT